MELLSEYKNGNYSVKLYSDGTKELFTDDDEFIAEFPDSIDLKITNYCELNCPMCHEESSVYGAHANLNESFISKLHAGTELAIGGGNPFSHPELETFLRRLKEQGVIANITINEKHLERYKSVIEKFIAEKLIYGLGISLSTYEDSTFKFAREYSSAVFHVICGVADLKKLLKKGGSKYKLLILGYKQKGRGEKYFSDEIKAKIAEFYKAIPCLFARYGIVSFDNLAIKQLDVKERVADEIWQERFMGDDGQNTMYVDLVEREFAVSSTSSIRYPLMESIEDMFEKVRIK